MAVTLAANQSLVVNVTSMQLPPLRSLVSEAMFQLVMESIFYVNAPIAFFGVLANTANIVVFYKMGFSVVSNISLFALAVSDRINLSYMILTMFSHHPDLLHVRVILPFPDATGFLSPIQFSASAFGSWVTAVISVERSVCVVFPMKVKMVFTRKTVFWLLMGMLFYQLSGVPNYASRVVASTVSPLTNRTIYFIDYSKFKADLSILSIFISFNVPTLVCFVVVVLSTIFLIITFKQSLQLRKTMSGRKQNTISTKDATMMRSVISICIIYIFGYSPVVTYYLITILDRNFHMYDPYTGKVVSIVFAASYTTQIIAGSANIFVYWTMSSKYKETFKALWSC